MAVPWEKTSRAAGEASPITPSCRVVLYPFEYHGVRLLPGMFQRQVEQTRETYFSLSNDDILRGFRREAGLPAPGKDLKGWARRKCDATFGQWLSGMARMARALGDADLRQKAIDLAEGWKQTIGKDGNCRTGTYGWEKFACGLVDLAAYAGYDPELRLLDSILDWAARRFDRTRSPATPFDRDGRRPRGTLEWYTLAENIYRAYLLTGREKFKAFADLWLYPSYWEKFVDSRAPAGVELLHAYSHVNSFCSAAMAHVVTGEMRYLKILRNAYEYVTRTQAYASGVFGPGEWTVPVDGTLGRALEIRSDSGEVPCGSWAGFKLSRYLICFTGEAKYGDWIETLMYNAIGAALPVQPDGRTYYYADYRLGAATKLYHWDEWPCCSGTFLQCIADYHNLIYFRNDRGLYVNLFVPSEVTWSAASGEVKVTQETRFPDTNEVRFKFEIPKPTKFAFHIRLPPWSKSIGISVNGNPLPVQKDPAGWACVERDWASGDELVLTLAPELVLVPVDNQHPNRVAIKYGPILLAQDARFTFPFVLDGNGINSRLTRESAGLRFRVNDTAQRVQKIGDFQPLYEIPERVPYRVYFDLDNARIL